MRILLGLVALFLAPASEVGVAIKIQNIESVKGCLRLAVFDSAADFEAEQDAVFDRVINLSSKADIDLRATLTGNVRHAVAVYHDENNNGKLDRTVVGIPKEPYAFSNNPAAKWQAPTFSEIAFLPAEASDTPLRLKLLKWGDR